MTSAPSSAGRDRDDADGNGGAGRCRRVAVEEDGEPHAAGLVGGRTARHDSTRVRARAGEAVGRRWPNVVGLAWHLLDSNGTSPGRHLSVAGSTSTRGRRPQGVFTVSWPADVVAPGSEQQVQTSGRHRRTLRSRRVGRSWTRRPGQRPPRHVGRGGPWGSDAEYAMAGGASRAERRPSRSRSSPSRGGLDQLDDQAEPDRGEPGGQRGRAQRQQPGDRGRAGQVRGEQVHGGQCDGRLGAGQGQVGGELVGAARNCLWITPKDSRAPMMRAAISGPAGTKSSPTTIEISLRKTDRASRRSWTFSTKVWLAAKGRARASQRMRGWPGSRGNPYPSTPPRYVWPRDGTLRSRATGTNDICRRPDPGRRSRSGRRWSCLVRQWFSSRWLGRAHQSRPRVGGPRKVLW